MALAHNRQKSGKRRIKLIAAVVSSLVLATGYASDRLMFRNPEKQIGHYERKISRILQENRVLAYWDFDDRTVRERVRHAAHDHAGAERTRGRYGMARHFTRSEGGRMLTGVSRSTADENYSISGWLKLSPSISNQAIFQDLVVTDGNLVYWVPQQNKGLSWPIAATNAFFHFAVTLNSDTGNARLYIDGDEVAQLAIQAEIRHRVQMIEFGQSKWKPPPDFVLDDLAIWDNPLSAEAVRELSRSGQSVGRRFAGTELLQLRFSRAMAALLHKISATFDLFNPFLHESRLYRADLQTIDLHMSKSDIKALNRYHHQRLDNAQTTRDTSARKSIRIRIGDRTYPARIEALGSAYDAESPPTRRTLIVDTLVNDTTGLRERILLEPFEHRATITALTAGALASRCGQDDVGPDLCVLSANGDILGAYMVIRNTIDRPFAWPHTTDHWLNLIRELPVSTEDVLATFDAVNDHYLRLLQCDPRSPLSSRAIRYAVQSKERRRLVESLQTKGDGTTPSQLAQTLRYIDERKLLGNNPCAELIFDDLDFSLRECNGVTLRYEHLAPAPQRADTARSLRPLDPKRMTVRVTASANGKSMSTNRHFMATSISNQVPTLRVRTSGKFSSTQRNACLVEVRNGQERTASAIFPGRIRYRGNSSLQKARKKYFSIKIDAPHNLFGMKNARYLLLTSWYRDKALMRDRLSYDLFRSFGGPDTPWASPQAQYVELVINGRYHGVYGVTERVDGDMLGYDPNNVQLDHPAVLYKAMDRKASFRELHVEAMVQREPHWRFGEHWQPYSDFVGFVSSTDADTFAARIPKLLNIENCIDFQILVNFTCNTEGVRFNYYLARRSEPGSRFFFIPWDYDMGYYQNRWLRNYLFDRLIADLPDYRRQLLTRWTELRKDLLSEDELMARIDALESELSGGSVQRNFNRWPPSRGQTHEQAVADLRKWIKTRLRYLDRKLAEILAEKK